MPSLYCHLFLACAAPLLSLSLPPPITSLAWISFEWNSPPLRPPFFSYSLSPPHSQGCAASFSTVPTNMFSEDSISPAAAGSMMRDERSFGVQRRPNTQKRTRGKGGREGGRNWRIAGDHVIGWMVILNFLHRAIFSRSLYELITERICTWSRREVTFSSSCTNGRGMFLNSRLIIFGEVSWKFLNCRVRNNLQYIQC